MKPEKKKLYVASCSFGKDSIATILLALENNEPLDRVVFAEVMFDHEKGISGEIPEHIEWIYNTAIPKLESMGVKVDVVRAEKDYKWFFTKGVITKGKWKGLHYGFPLGGHCVVNRECKSRLILRYYKQFEDCDICQYVGIASDEIIRLKRLNKNQVSLLAKYGYTERMASNLCKEKGLLSPIYETETRGGCWFCPNAKIDGFISIRRNHPELWNELRELSKIPNLCSYGFKYGKTLQQVEKEMDAKEINNKLQLSLF